jgi:diguanylate cyclase (GGDEF)-like protein
LVHVALADERDAAVVVDWARDRGFPSVRVVDLQSALEHALEAGRPAVIVIDANLAAGSLIDARTLISVSEQPLGLLLVCEPSDWTSLAVFEEAGIEPIRGPVHAGELDWRVATVLQGGARGRAAREATEQALALAVDLIAPAADPDASVVRLLADRYPDFGFATARWRGNGADLFDVVELARSGEGRPDWTAIRESLQNGPLAPLSHSNAAGKSRGMMLDGDHHLLAAAPIADEDGSTLGGMLAWSVRGADAPAGLDAAVRIAAARLATEFRFASLREHSRRLVERDALTRLANRAQFNARLNDAVRVARSGAEKLAVLMVNLDRFKSVNEAYGHALGDRVLVESARRIRQTVRGTDLVARYAGDEFAVCLRELRGRPDAETVATKLRLALSEAIVLEEGIEARLTASIGICHYPDDGASGEDLVRQADIALRAGKGLGSDQTHVFVADLRESRRERATLESRLRAAEGRGELRLHFQPQVSARDEDIVGVEALIRWEHPDMGMVSPGFFIPLAEETGLIVSIGRWVLFEACRQARAWQQRFGLPLRVAVNLSAVQLGRREIVAEVTAALAETGLPPETLELEVTESVSVKRIPHLIASLEALRSLGCQIAIDDFGTGQASLDYIRRFPADRIKIDQVFVRNIGIDPDDEAIVRATIGMAHSLGRHVVAEGVEYEQHASFLREQGCDELQGFLFCRPLPVVALENLLAERERHLADRR